MDEKQIKLYFAPLEGITGFLLRNIHHELYGGIDRYYTPFITPGVEKGIHGKGFRDMLPENNKGIPLIPQILTNRAYGFIETAHVLFDHGYREVNLNLGCPSGTVVSKGRGSGFLAFPKELEAFFDEIFSDPLVVSKELGISVKTRIGRDSKEEWPALLELFNRYPIKELIVHPRIRKDMYKNQPDLEAFQMALKISRNPVVYNGDLFSAAAVLDFCRRFPEADAIMLGRGLLMDPALAEKIREGKDVPLGLQSEKELERLREYHDRILREYEGVMSGDRNLLFKMKELWLYLSRSFPQEEKLLKKIQKAQKLSDYLAVTEALWAAQNMEMRERMGKDLP